MLKVRMTNDTAIEAGIDEAGRGCLWGPLFAAAVIWPPEEEWIDEQRELAPLIKDSKKITPKKRALIAEAIKSYAVDYGIGSVSAAEIDSMGMSRANRLAFLRALDALDIPPDRILIDGTLPLFTSQLEERKINQQETIIDGDATYLSIAAASILAKEAHDDLVKEWVATEPSLHEKYHLGSCKGYGTAAHRKGILDNGKHTEHRNLFLRKLLGNTVFTNEETCLISDD
jgi:ribonuclease HII